MKNTTVYGTILMLLLQGTSESQSRKIELPVSDKSFAGAPLRPVGNANMSSEITSKGIESTAEMTAVLKNISTKPIMAFEAVTDLFPSYGGGDRVTTHVDYFFDEPFMPGSTSEITVEPHKTIVFWNKAEHPAILDDVHHTAQPRADVTVTFVQFADGTTFGASQWASSLIPQRVNTVATMRGLLRAFDKDGESGLKSAIEKEQAKPGLPMEISAHLSLIQQKLREAGATAAAEYLKDRLANAQRRSNLLGATIY